MTLKEIEYLLTTARCASISEAAKQLYVAQPSLTHAIQSVEREVGFRIFERGRSGVSVTEQGEEFLADIRTVYERMTAVHEKYCAEKQPVRSVFSISVQHFSPAGEAFARFLRELEEPYYSARFLEGNMADVIADVAAERSEIGFLHFPQNKEQAVFRELRGEKVEFYAITCGEPCVLLREGHPLAGQETISRQNLMRCPILSYDYGTENTVGFSDEDPSLLQGDRRIVVSNGLMLRRLLLETDACAVSVRADAGALLSGGGIMAKPLEGAQPLRIGWIKKWDTPLQPLTKRYLRMLNPGQ